MAKGKNNWVLFIVIGIILLIILYQFSKSDTNIEEESEKDLKQKRINALQTEKSLLISHKEKTTELEAKIDQKSEKLWRRFIRILTLLFLVINLVLYLTFPDINNLLVIWTVITGVINISWLILFIKLFSLKTFLFINLREYSYKLIAGHRDAEYFAVKHETIEDRVAQVNLELNQLLPQESKLI